MTLNLGQQGAEKLLADMNSIKPMHLQLLQTPKETLINPCRWKNESRITVFIQPLHLAINHKISKTDHAEVWKDTRHQHAGHGTESEPHVFKHKETSLRTRGLNSAKDLGTNQ